MSSYVPSECEKEQFMSRAIALSEEGASKGHGFPFGAVVVKDGTIVAEGYNRAIVDVDPSAHAEVVTIRRAAKALNTPQLMTCYLFTSCQPCAMCTSVIFYSRLKGVYYAQPIEGSIDPLIESEKAILKYINTAVDQRDDTEQVASKADEALAVMEKYLYMFDVPNTHYRS